MAPGQTWSRRSRTAPLVIGAFVAGVLVAAVVIPSHDDDTPATVSTAATPVEAGAGQPAPATDAGGQATADTAPVSYGAAAGNGSSGAAATPAGPSAVSGTPTTQGSATVGGATAPGVTANTVKVGVIDLDSNDLTPVCPRCGNGDGSKGAAEHALQAAWRRDRRLPVNGRDLQFDFKVVGALSPEDGRNACVDMAQRVKPFIVIAASGAFAAAQCLAKEFHIPVVYGSRDATQAFITANSPNFVQVGPTQERLLRNWVHWADAKGFLRGQVLGLYSEGTPEMQAALDHSLRPELEALGYTLKTDMQSSGQSALGSGSTDAVAMQRFRSDGVTVALLLTGFLGFQNAAEQQGYHPRYLVTDVGYTFTDAVADITYNPSAMDGNYGYISKGWQWAARRPATLVGNATAAYCLKAYTDHLHRTLDVYDNDSEINYVTTVCAAMEVLREALQRAGPNLTHTTFLQGLYGVRNFETSSYQSVSFAPGKLSGSDVASTAQFKKARWQPQNLYWAVVEPWRRFWVA